MHNTALDILILGVTQSEVGIDGSNLSMKVESRKTM